MRDKIDGFVLAGGAGSRMGRDKALVKLCGVTLAERAADRLKAVSENIYIVGPYRKDIALPIVSDRFETRASIVGLHSALSNSKTEATAVLACDLPFASGELLKFLAAIYDEEQCDAVVPKQNDGRLQPLCAIYNTADCLASVEQAIASGDLRLHAMLEQIDVRYVEPAEIAHLPDSDLFFLNINRPADLDRAAAICERRGF